MNKNEKLQQNSASELNDDALGAVAGGCVSVVPAPHECSKQEVYHCPTCGQSYKNRSFCPFCLIQDVTSRNRNTVVQEVSRA